MGYMSGVKLYRMIVQEKRSKRVVYQSSPMSENSAKLLKRQRDMTLDKKNYSSSVRVYNEAAEKARAEKKRIEMEAKAKRSQKK